MRGLLGAVAAAIALTGVAHAPVAHADDYPSRPLKMIQGFPAGGNADNVARVLAQEMSKGLGQPVVVESKPGAGGTVGAALVAKAPADGYTLLLVTGGHAVAGATYKSLPYHTVDDFAWISTATLFPFVVAVRSDGEFTTLKALLAAAKAKPGSVNYGAPGVGATQHLTTELLAGMAGVKFQEIPYRGEGAAVTAMLSREIDFFVTAASAVQAHLAAGTFKAIAVTSSTRWSGLPDVPTVAEAGVPGFDVSSWAGVATTAGVSPAIVERLNAELRRTLQVPEVATRLQSFGGDVHASSPAEMRTRVATELERWTTVVRDAHIEQQ
jgi:tripartite-type tricarboxylate transporter receptor subunit TctC